MRILLLLLFPFVVSAQSMLSGWVVDAKTKQPVAFATVGLIRANSGVTATEAGHFTLGTVQSLLKDTLVVSCVGYQTKKIAVKNLTGDSIRIELDAFVQELTPVVVGKRDWNYVRLNEFESCGTIGIGSNAITTQLAQLFTAPQEHSILHSVQICRFSIPIIAPQRAIFRLRIYAMDSLTRKPSRDLCTQVIEVKTSSKNVLVDLSPYNIVIPNKEFFIAIEWLKIPINEETVLERTKDGKKKISIELKPTIFWAGGKTSIPSEVWMMSYTNKWFKVHTSGDRSSLAITPTVKF